MFRGKVLLSFGILVAAACFDGSAAEARPEPTWLDQEYGPFDVGTTREIWTDESRLEPLTQSAADNRRLTIQIWYPARIADEERATYAPEIADYDEWSRKSFAPVAARTTAAHVGPELSNEQAQYPVVLYSHGFGVPSFSGTFLTEFLASQGFVVVGIGHTGWDARVHYPDGYSIPEIAVTPPTDTADDLSPVERYHRAANDAEQRQRRATALDDIGFVIDELEMIAASPSRRFFGRLDLSALGAIGFSSGGADYLEATLLERRLAAAVDLDGGFNGYSVIDKGTTVPVLLFQSSNSYGTVTSGPTHPGIEELASEVERNIWKMLRLSSGPWYRATIERATHPSFTDGFLIVPPPEGVIAPEQAHRIINAVTLEFLDRYLRGSVQTPILDYHEAIDGLRLITGAAGQD
jgi:Platelet-activating factor acetylhydrolase, isoform II